MTPDKIREKPRLTKKVLRGLSHFVGLVSAGGMEEILGNDLEHSPKEERKELSAQWSDIQAACKWISEMQSFKSLSTKDGEG